MRHRRIRGLGPGHPCVCGEQLRVDHAADFHHGSSLRVRGTGRCEPPRRSSGRGIPACAGNRRVRKYFGAAIPGHPCVCGEQATFRRFELRRCGSSLRVRGTGQITSSPIPLSRVIPACAGNVMEHLADACGERVIPACAGNRAASWRWPGAAPGHPCVCGEQIVNRQWALRTMGSSLRVRGTDSVIWCTTECSCQIQPP